MKSQLGLWNPSTVYNSVHDVNFHVLDECSLVGKIESGDLYKPYIDYVFPICDIHQACED